MTQEDRPLNKHDIEAFFNPASSIPPPPSAKEFFSPVRSIPSSPMTSAKKFFNPGFYIPPSPRTPLQQRMNESPGKCKHQDEEYVAATLLDIKRRMEQFKNGTLPQENFMLPPSPKRRRTVKMNKGPNYRCVKRERILNMK